MQRRDLLSLVVCMALPALAAGEIGQPSSFSVTISRAPGTITASLQVTTQGAQSLKVRDMVMLQVALAGVGFPTTPQSYTVARIPPTSRQFANSFSFSVVDEHLPFKYLAIAYPVEGGPPSYVFPTYYTVVSFKASNIADVDARVVPTASQQGETQSWVWWKGRQELAAPISALSFWGLAGLATLLALAGAFLMRRS